jgi:hypothetical protein
MHTHSIHIPYSNLLSFCTYLLAEIDLNEALHAIGRSIKDVTQKIKTFLAQVYGTTFSRREMHTQLVCFKIRMEMLSKIINIPSRELNWKMRRPARGFWFMICGHWWPLDEDIHSLRVALLLPEAQMKELHTQESSPLCAALESERKNAPGPIAVCYLFVHQWPI